MQKRTSFLCCDLSPINVKNNTIYQILYAHIVSIFYPKQYAPFFVTEVQ